MRPTLLRPPGVGASIDPRPVMETQEEQHAHRPGVLWVQLASLGILALGGLMGGVSFIADPTGASLGAKLSWLDRTPVNDFAVPGWFLLLVYGIGGLAVMAGLIWKVSPGPLSRFDRYAGYHWAWAASILLGGVLVLWIVYELIVMPETTWLQPALIAIGLVIAGVPFLPSMRRWFAVDVADPYLPSR